MSKAKRRLSVGAAVLLTVSCLHGMTDEAIGAEGTQLRFSVTDATGQLLPCRIHVSNEEGEPQTVAGLPFWRDHFSCDGKASVDVTPGRYDWAIERGPEFERKSGTVQVSDQTVDVALSLQRIAHLRQEGWYSGDMHVHRPVADIEALMLAEDLDFAPVITWWNQRSAWDDATIPPRITNNFDGHRIYSVMAGEDEREGGALLYFGLDKPLDITARSREIPSPMVFVSRARKQDPKVWIDIEKPFWWDVPTWLASGKMNSIGLANNHMCHRQMLANEAWGKPRDVQRLPDPRGNGFWTQEIYYQILDAGLRIPPSAGSASGVLPNPVGYNRVYVHQPSRFSRDSWFQSLASGHCFVTNGPLLRVTANQRLPGSVLNTSGHEAIKLFIKLTSNDPVPAIEIIYNGKVARTIECSSDTEQKLTVSFEADQPGWFLVRAVADVDETFRFASTAPWYLESESVSHRISKSATRFFLDWVDERITRIGKNVNGPEQLRAVLEPHQRAKDFWSRRLADANVDE